MSSEVALTGGKELADKMLELERKSAKTIGRKAVRKATAVVRKAARANAKAMVGGTFGTLLARHIATGTPRRQRRGTYTLDVGPHGEDKFPESVEISASGRRNYIPAALEYGHGSARPIPFLRRAWDTTKREALAVIQREIAAGIERVAKGGKG